MVEGSSIYGTLRDCRCQELISGALVAAVRQRIPMRAVSAASGTRAMAARSHATGVIVGRSRSVPGMRRDAVPEAQQSRDDFSRLAILAILDLPESPVDDAQGNVFEWDDDAGQRGIQQLGAGAAVETDNREVAADGHVELCRHAVHDGRNPVTASKHGVWPCR